MRFSLTSSVGLLLTVILIITSCSQLSNIEDIEGIEFEADFAIPFIDSKSTLQQLLDASGEDLTYLDVDEEGNYAFHYEDEGPEKRSDELFSLPSFPFAFQDTMMEIPLSFIENLSIDELNMKEGTLAFELSSQHAEDILVEITLPQLTKDGQVFSISRVIDYQGASPTKLTIDPVSIQGYTFNFTKEVLVIKYKATTMNQQPADVFIAGEARDWSYEYIKGSWANETIDLGMDTLEIDVFEENINGEITFSDPVLSIQIENSIGFSVMALINTLQFVTGGGQKLNLESTLFDEGIMLNYPALNEVNVVKYTTITFDNSNSNIAEILSSYPKQVIYDIGLMMNPENNADLVGFITNDGIVKANIHTSIAAKGSVSNLVVNNTFDIELKDLDEVTHAEFKLITDNGLPIGSRLQFYFLDQNDQVIDSLFTTETLLLNAASVNSEGEVVKNAVVTTLIDVPANRMSNILRSTKIQSQTNLHTSNDGTMSVRIQAHQELGVKLGAIIGVKN